MQTGLVSGANAGIGPAISVHFAAEVSVWMRRRGTHHRVT